MFKKWGWWECGGGARRLCSSSASAHKKCVSSSSFAAVAHNNYATNSCHSFTLHFVIFHRRRKGDNLPWNKSRFTSSSRTIKTAEVVATVAMKWVWANGQTSQQLHQDKRRDDWDDSFIFYSSLCLVLKGLVIITHLLPEYCPIRRE